MPIPSDNTPIYPVPSRFATLVKHVVGIEGGFVDDKTDRGGTTKYGISLRFLVTEGAIDLNKDGFKDFDLDMDGDIDGEDIRRLTSQQACNLYYRCFWQRNDLGSLPAPLDGAVFDQAVNGGAVAAFKLLQKAINQMVSDKLIVDGVPGPATRNRISRLVSEKRVDKLISWYRLEAEWRYRDIVVRLPDQKKFLNGWVNRAKQLGSV